MDVSAPLFNAALLALFTLVLAWLGKGRFEALERRMDRLEDRMDKRFEQLEAQVAAIRSDLTRIALALGTQQQPETG